MSRLMYPVILILALIDTAHAHFVWLERDGEGPARAYFGEWIDDIREKTGGLLDRFKAPRVFLGTSNDPLPVKRNENNLEFDVKGRGDVRFVDSSVPPREDKEKGGVTKTIYYAKAGRSETAAKLDLELVPTTSQWQNFCSVIFRRAAGQSRTHDHRSVQMGKTSGDRRPRSDHTADALGRALRIGNHLFRRKARRQRRGKV